MMNKDSILKYFNCGKGIDINEGQRLKSQNKVHKTCFKNFLFLNINMQITKKIHSFILPLFTDLLLGASTEFTMVKNK